MTAEADDGHEKYRDMAEMTNRRIAKCLVVASAPIVAASLMGSAQLDSNHVAPSSLGEVNVAVAHVTTSLTVDDAKINLAQDSKGDSYYKFIGIGATLSTASGPAPAGLEVVFSVGSAEICRGLTNKAGQAECDATKPNPNVPADPSAPLPTVYTATFDGSGDGGLLLDGSTADGVLTPKG